MTAETAAYLLCAAALTVAAAGLAGYRYGRRTGVEQLAQALGADPRHPEPAGSTAPDEPTDEQVQALANTLSQAQARGIRYGAHTLARWLLARGYHLDPAVRRCQFCGCTDTAGCYPTCWWMPGLQGLDSVCTAPECVRQTVLGPAPAAPGAVD